MHEEDFWSNCLREDERVKKKEWQTQREEENVGKEEKRRGERRVRNGDGQKKM